MIVSAISDSPSLPRTDASPAGVSGVSVIIPVHNAAKTLAATLNSVFEQTHVVWEAIVVDDGSMDGTRTIANSWAQRDRRVKPPHHKNRGGSAPRNRGLQEARYSYILFLDGGDRTASVHLENMLAKLCSYSAFDALHCA